MSIIDPIEFQSVEGALNRAHSLVGTAESHGILYGMSCCGAKPDFSAWYAQVLADSDPSPAVEQECKEVLASVYQNTLNELSSPDISFQPMVPDDDTALGLRTQSLGNWCAGFLYGLGLGGISEESELTRELREIFRDFGELSKVQFDIEGSVEESEQAYMEILEYVRTAMLLVKEELQTEVSAPKLQ